MKIKLFFFLFLFAQFSLDLFAQTDPWECITNNGFGDTKNIACSKFLTFKGKIFTTTQRKKGNPPGQLWYSTTGDSLSWNKVTSFSPNFSNSDLNIFCGGTTDTSGGIAFISTVNVPLGTAVYRSTNGTNWTKINNNGFGVTANYRTSPTIVVYKDSLYAATWNNNAAQIWRCLSTNTSAANWQKVIDFSAIDTIVKNITYLYIWNGTLYAAMGGNITHGGNLYQTTNGSVWTKNTGVGNGFGSSGNGTIASLIAFNGYLYAGTNNLLTGGQLWKTSDGNLWTQVTADAFGQGTSIYELKRMAVAGGYLWVTGNPSSGNSDKIWKSKDGINFTQSNINGFGNSNNSGFPVLGDYNDNIYYGGLDSITGGQIWRTCITPVASFNSVDTNICQGTTLNFVNTSSYAHSYIWQINGVNYSAGIDTSIIFNTAGKYTITLLSNNGICTKDTSINITVNTCTGTDQTIAQDISCIVYPNPFSSSAIIQFNSVIKNAVLNIYNLFGQKIITINNISGNQIKIERANLNSGIYFYKVMKQNEENISNGKLIITD